MHRDMVGVTRPAMGAAAAEKLRRLAAVATKKCYTCRAAKSMARAVAAIGSRFVR